MTSENTSLEKYTSHTLFDMVAKGLWKGNVWEVSWWLNRDCNILTPSFSVFSSTSFSFCWAAQLGALRAQPSAESWFSLPRPVTTDSKLTEPPVAPGYIIVWHPPASCESCICTQFNPSTVKVIPWYPRPHAPVSWSTAGSEVNMLQYDSSDPQKVSCVKHKITSDCNGPVLEISEVWSKLPCCYSQV